MSHISLDRVSVEIPIYSGLDRSLKLSLFRSAGGAGMLRSAGGAIARDRRNRIVVRALDDVTLDIHEGDRVALLGRNGAGKTTLLRVMADVMEPTGGEVRISGQTSTLFNLAGLMDPELPGYENVFFAGGLIGIPRSRLKKLMPEIEAFAELGDFLGMPVRTYSAGMKVRLGFAVATCIVPDILLMDEIIGAGDAHFVEKAIRRAQQLYKQSNILVVASHAPELLHGLCNKAILLDRGKVIAMGALDDVGRIYADGAWSPDAPSAAAAHS
jgi:ABC-type polysaccharide/polyol phosphate transport system ATPase subunit